VLDINFLFSSPQGLSQTTLRFMRW